MKRKLHQKPSKRAVACAIVGALHIVLGLSAMVLNVWRLVTDESMSFYDFLSMGLGIVLWMSLIAWITQVSFKSAYSKRGRDDLEPALFDAVDRRWPTYVSNVNRFFSKKWGR